ncbi:sialidase family protein [Fodinicola acaciae]|uniref:sialidase family protein n=1 Tax=Fodinicola acaciae TaxID=2681555 RepID=UPI001FE4AA2A|nr:sialidase family protein [Fodinicola acaciae]
MMSDELVRLREDVVAAGRFPDLDDLGRQARGRVRRRRVAGVAAVAVLAALAIAAIPLLTGSHGTKEQPAAGPDLLAGSVRGSIAGGPVTLTKAMKAQSYEVVDQRQVYALVQDGKRFAVARTTDSGATWHAWQVPAGAAKPDSTGYVLTPFVALSRTVLLLGDYVSRDAGQTWSKAAGQRVAGNVTNWQESRPLTITVGAPVEAFGRGQVMNTFCAGDGSVCHLYAVDLSTVVWHQLARQPAMTSAAAGRDGVLWAVRQVEFGKPGCTVSHSTDGGANWSTYQVPVAYGCVLSPPVTAADGTTYALLMRSNGTAMTGTAALVSTDGGTTWTKKALGADLAQLAVSADGTLWGTANSDAGFLVSRDGGRTFSSVPDTGSPVGFRTTVTGAYISPIGGAAFRNNFRVSEDGVHWSVIPAAPVDNTVK